MLRINRWNRFAGLSALGLALTLALTTNLDAQGFGRGGPGRGPGPGFGFEGPMAMALDLTDAQKAQFRSIREAAQAESEPARQQLEQAREQLQAAVEAGQSGAALQGMAAQQGELMGQLIGIQASSHEQMFALLTPEQKQKLEQLKADRKAGWEKRTSRRQSRNAPSSDR